MLVCVLLRMCASAYVAVFLIHCAPLFWYVSICIFLCGLIDKSLYVFTKSTLSYDNNKTVTKHFIEFHVPIFYQRSIISNLYGEF